MKLRLRPGRKLPGRSFLWLPLLNEESLWGTDCYTSAAALACNDTPIEEHMRSVGL